jgi:hypothetical protein
MPEFKVTISVMQESHRTTYWVVLTHADRPSDIMPWDDRESRTTPFMSEILEHVCIEAYSWARFLQCDVDNSQVKDLPDYPSSILIL